MDKSNEMSMDSSMNTSYKEQPGVTQLNNSGHVIMNKSIGKINQTGDDSVNISIDIEKMPFLKKLNTKHQNLQTLKIVKKLKFKNYPFEEPQFLTKVKQYAKYEIKTYEATMLVQVIKNIDLIDVFEDEYLKKKFQTLLLAIFDDPKPMRIKDLTVNKEIFPAQVEFIVDFVTRIGKDPFHKVNLQPLNYKDQGPDHEQIPRYIVNYFISIKEQTHVYPQDFLILANILENESGQIQLVKHRRNNQIYTLKILTKLNNEKQLKALLKFEESSFQSSINKYIIRELLFMKTLRDVTKIKHPNMIELENFWVQKGGDNHYRMHILTSYFGGADFVPNCLYDFFYPNEGKILPQHFDIGEEEGKAVISQIFYQLLDVVEFLHSQGFFYKNINDENILIRRRDRTEEDGYNVPFVFEIVLCDFGMQNTFMNQQFKRAGVVTKKGFPNHDNMLYQDLENIEKYPAACDLYAMGELLHTLILLYHFYWYPNEQAIMEKYGDFYKEEIELIKVLQAPIQSRPKQFQQLKQNAAYNDWIQSLPQYIPVLFANQVQFID